MAGRVSMQHPTTTLKRSSEQEIERIDKQIRTKTPVIKQVAKHPFAPTLLNVFV